MTKLAQMLPTFAGRDAIGNEVILLADLLEKHGISSSVIAQNISETAKESVACECTSDTAEANADIMLFHHSIASDLTRQFADSSAFKVLRYHNVTPPEFFSDYNIVSESHCRQGLEQVEAIASDVDLCLADSQFNKECLREMGYTCPIEVVPLLIPFEDYSKEPDLRLLEKLRNSPGTKILFVGRVAPNKCQHDLIKTFYLYKKRYDPDAKLFIVGAHSPYDRYYASLVKLVDDLGLEDVVFAGSVSFQQLIAYYKGTDVFLCESEHEGFCVPLVESMFFDLPVVAYDSTAVKETMGPGTLVFPTKEPAVLAGITNKLMVDIPFRDEVLAAQRRRVKDFELETVREQFLTALGLDS